MNSTLAEIEESLAEMKTMLLADGYTLSIAESEEGLDLRIIAGSDTCEDCLIPKPVMAELIRSKLPDYAKAITIRYPADK